MKLLLLTRGMSPYKGGLETYADKLLEGLSKHHKVFVVTYYHPSREKKSNILEIHQISQNRQKEYLNFFFKSILTSLKLDFDVIHANGELTGLPGIFIKIIKRKPLITMIHDTGFVRENTQWSKLGRWLRIYIRKIVTRMSNKVILPSEGVRQQMSEYLNLPVNLFEVIPYGADSKFFNDKIKGVLRSKLNIPKRTFVIYFVGMLYPKKGLEYLIEALKYVREKTDNFKLVVTGVEIYSGYRNKLDSLIKEFNLENKVIFTGLVYDLEKWYRDCDVFILPSVDTEGLSLTCLGAAASRRPVITTTILAETGAVVKDKTALVVPPKDTKALARAIIRLINNKSLRQKLGKNGREYASKFKWEEMVKNTEKLYKELISD